MFLPHLAALSAVLQNFRARSANELGRSAWQRASAADHEIGATPRKLADVSRTPKVFPFTANLSLSLSLSRSLLSVCLSLSRCSRPRVKQSIDGNLHRHQ